MKLRQLLKNEEGAATIVEASIVFPIVFLIVLFLFIMGYYQLEVATLQTRADRVADLTGRLVVVPGYDNLFEGNLSSKAIDFENMPKVNNDMLKKIYSNLDPYRYCGTGEKEVSGSLLDEVGKIATDEAYMNPRHSLKKVDVSIKKSGVTTKVITTVSSDIRLPGFLKLLGLQTSTKASTKGIAYVSDTSEFMRNTDIVFDLSEFLAEKSGLSKKLSDAINKMKTQFEFLGIKQTNGNKGE